MKTAISIETPLLEEADRTAKRLGLSRSRLVYVGLRPKRSESGQSQPELRITKEGDRGDSVR